MSKMDTGKMPSPLEDERKSHSAAETGDIRRAENVVRIESFGLARDLLRSTDVRQAGFSAELVERFTRRAHAPVLYQDGEAHQKQRSATARFFAPKVVATRYRELMETISDRLVRRLIVEGRAELDTMSLELAVAVAAEIIGLTESDRSAMARRLNRFFSANGSRNNSLSAFFNFAAGQWRMLSFYLGDVRPALKARRQSPRDDLISHLIGQDYSNREILTECLTYGAAGMVTTREFIVMAAWHLLERDDLRRSFLDGDEANRIALLEEILRLEPVIGALYRRTSRELSLESKGDTTTLPAGTLVEVDIRAANTDPEATGVCPFRVDAKREMKSKAFASVLSFGDGPHRCPGASVALQETAIFLDRLLRVPGVHLSHAPLVGWNPLIASYELRGAVVSLKSEKVDG